MLLEEGHPQTLLDDDPGGVPLQVKHVLRILGHRSHAGVEVRTLWVGHVLKTLPPHGLLLLADQEHRDRYRGGVVEAAHTKGGEGDVCCLLNRLVQLDFDDSRPHGSVGLRGNITRTSHLSWPWALDMRPR
jgi:hypothetical protein